MVVRERGRTTENITRQRDRAADLERQRVARISAGHRAVAGDRDGPGSQQGTAHLRVVEREAGAGDKRQAAAPQNEMIIADGQAVDRIVAGVVRDRMDARRVDDDIIVAVRDGSQTPIGGSGPIAIGVEFPTVDGRHFSPLLDQRFTSCAAAVARGWPVAKSQRFTPAIIRINDNMLSPIPLRKFVMAYDLNFCIRSGRPVPFRTCSERARTMSISLAMARFPRPSKISPPMRRPNYSQTICLSSEALATSNSKSIP